MFPNAEGYLFLGMENPYCFDIFKVCEPLIHNYKHINDIFCQHRMAVYSPRHSLEYIFIAQKTINTQLLYMPVCNGSIVSSVSKRWSYMSIWKALKYSNNYYNVAWIVLLLWLSTQWNIGCFVKSIKDIWIQKTYIVLI